MAAENGWSEAMSSAMNFVPYTTGTEDPLALLPRTPIREYSRNDVIYRPEDRAEVLYLVIQGRVKVSRQAAPEQGACRPESCLPS